MFWEVGLFFLSFWTDVIIGVIMALMASYLIKTSNLPEFLNSLQSAKAPERFTNKFLNDLEFKSSNDRLFIGILKGLGFIDDSGVPQQRYYEFLDPSNSGTVLAQAIEEAYADLFNLRKDAYKLEINDIKGKFKSLTQGQKSDNVIHQMALTFKALCENADWSETRKVINKSESTEDLQNIEYNKDEQSSKSVIVDRNNLSSTDKLQLHYNIQLILPNSKDPAVFDAFFSALKRHLL